MAVDIVVVIIIVGDIVAVFVVVAVFAVVAVSRLRQYVTLVKICLGLILKEINTGLLAYFKNSLSNCLGFRIHFVSHDLLLHTKESVHCSFAKDRLYLR